MRNKNCNHKKNTCGKLKQKDNCFIQHDFIFKDLNLTTRKLSRHTSMENNKINRTSG